MLLTLVNKDNYRFEDANHEIILERESDIVPIVGDLIKDGHSLSGFTVYQVEQRVFRSTPKKNGTEVDFDQVYLVVTEVMQR